MEPITIFAASVGLVGVCRLTFVAADFFGKGIYYKGSKPTNRCNWYCFFNTSNLWGVTKRRKALHPEEPPEYRRHPYQRIRIHAPGCSFLMF